MLRKRETVAPSATSSRQGLPPRLFVADHIIVAPQGSFLCLGQPSPESTLHVDAHLVVDVLGAAGEELCNKG